MSRLQKENDLKASFGGIKLSDLPSKDPAGSFGLQSSINVNQNDVPNGSYQFSGDNFFVQDVDTKNHEGDLKRVVSETTDTKRTLTADLPDPQDMRSSQMSFDHSFGSLDSEVNFSAIPAPYSWSEAPKIQFKDEIKPLLQLEDGFSQLPPSGLHNHIQIDPSQSASSITSGLSMTGREICGPEKIKPLYAQYCSNHVSLLSPKESAFDNFPVQSKSHVEKHQSFEPISTAISSMKPQGFNLSSITTDFESCQRNLISATDSTFEPFNEDLRVCWLEGDCHSMNFGLPNVEFTDYTDPGFIAEFPIYFCDTLTSDTECPFDQPEYSIVDQGLFLS